MLAHALHWQVQLLTMPVSKERIQTDAGAARTEASKIAVQKGPFVRAPFSWTDDLYNAASQDSGFHSDSECASRVRSHLDMLLFKFEFSTRSVAKVMPLVRPDRASARTRLRELSDVGKSTEQVRNPKCKYGMRRNNTHG